MDTHTARTPRKVLSRRSRSWLLTLHVISGVGWLGVAITMLLISWTNQDPSQHYAVNLVMERMDSFLMIPLPLVAIVTGILLSWGTVWGFFRWYWVIVKQIATYALLLLAPFTVHEWIVQMTNLSRAGVAGAQYAVDQQLHVLVSLVFVSTGAAIAAISVLKPWGRRGAPPRRHVGAAQGGPAGAPRRERSSPVVGGVIGQVAGLSQLPHRLDRPPRLGKRFGDQRQAGRRREGRME